MDGLLTKDDLKRSRTLAILAARLALQVRRDATGSTTGSTIAVNARLDEQDQALFNALSAHYKKSISQDSGASPEEAEKLFAACIEPYGKKFLVEWYLTPPLISGVPRAWMIINMVITLLAYLTWWRSIDVLLIVPFVIWIPQYIFYSNIRDSLRKKKIEKALAQGIRI